jgi:hypothetical protein
MPIIAAIRESINKRRDSRIINCLREFGIMTETELQARTAIPMNALRSRLEFLAEHEQVSHAARHLATQPNSCWKIHHPPVTVARKQQRTEYHHYYFSDPRAKGAA